MACRNRQYQQVLIVMSVKCSNTKRLLSMYTFNLLALMDFLLVVFFCPYLLGSLMCRQQYTLQDDPVVKLLSFYITILLYVLTIFNASLYLGLIPIFLIAPYIPISYQNKQCMQLHTQTCFTVLTVKH